MEHLEKIKRLENHIANNPKDYQSIISLYKMKSDQIAYERMAKQIDRLKKIQECRRNLYG